ncbi:MAG TPA: sulfatase/phosphatase domain-containing protein, partial [Candidatus Sulfotelmatobacter sp.]|nr:sulfatase/phosphatase domain-containing protein [Candidatus Sulfotelmatobacter sp.]
QIDCMDQGIGRLIAALEKTGQLENTLLFFLQDNGGCAEPIGRSGHTARAAKPTLPALAPDVVQQGSQPKQTRDGWPVLGGTAVLPGPADTFIAYGKAWANVSDTPYREYKHWVHEGGISTPLIVHWPQRVKTPGQLRTQPGHLIDIMATCVEVAGAKYPAVVNGQSITPLEGKSLLPAFDNRPIQRQALFWEHEGNRAVRVDHWKLVAKGPAGKWELYDLAADRTELHDLAEQQPERVKEMASQWEGYARRAQVLPWIWEPQYGGTQVVAKAAACSPALRFELKPGADLEKGQRPNLAGRGFSITVQLAQAGTNGVLLAQGGSAHGVALYFKDANLHFVLRRDNALHEVSAPAARLGSAKTLRATLAADASMHLSADGREVAAGKADGLLTRLPTDGLQVGQDLRGAVGDYAAPFPFDGGIQSVELILDK